MCDILRVNLFYWLFSPSILCCWFSLIWRRLFICTLWTFVQGGSRNFSTQRKNSNKTLTNNWHWIWYCFFYTKVLLHALKFFFVSSILRFFLIFIYMLLKQAHQKLFKNIISYPLWHSHLSRIFQTRLLLLLQTKWKALLRFIFEELVKRD